MSPEEGVFKVLDNLSIEFDEYHHPPVFTVEEADQYWVDIEATHCKNLFFRDKKGKNHFLLITEFKAQIDIREFGKSIGAGRLSFASPERLKNHLGLTPGSVSPFGLINNKDKTVKVFLDKELEKAKMLGFHPNINSITITLSKDDFLRFLDWTGNPYSFL